MGGAQWLLRHVPCGGGSPSVVFDVPEGIDENRHIGHIVSSYLLRYVPNKEL